MSPHQPRHDESTDSHFEENYLLRTIGPIAEDAGMALTELVANAWDAGASLVDLTIPEMTGGTLIVEDDGHGMTADQFRQRWMTLGYDRLKRQGVEVEFPALRSEWRRCAYGRSGMGRHGLLCFADRYAVETWRDGQAMRVDIAAPAPSTPIGIESEVRLLRDGHGTRISVAVQRRFAEAAHIRALLAATFLHDPRFVVRVNGESVTAADLSGSIDRTELRLDGNRPVVVSVVDTMRATRGVSHVGISFWVNGRRVGTPNWTIDGEALIDAQGRFGRRYAVVVQAGEAWLPEVGKDWRAFKRGTSVDALHLAVRDHVRVALDQWGDTVSEESSEDALMRHRTAFGMLTPMQRAGVATFTRELVKATPAVSQDVLSAAVLAAIRLEQSRGGSGLLDRLSALGDSDIEGLNRLLHQWTIRDALTVLDEIDHRLAVLATLDRLSGDPTTDELQVLHPLVAQSRWLFGAEFDSAEYVSNVSLRTGAEKIFKKRLAPTAFANHRKRPDLLLLADATCSVVGTEGFGADEERLIRHQNVLVVELKRGGHVLQRVDLWQALGYLDDFYRSGALDWPSQLNAFVVGHTIGEGAEREMPFFAGGMVRGKVQAVTYGQLTRSAHRRLLRMKDRIPTRYEDMSGADLSARIMRAAQPEST
jgi:hypothetical protein